MGSGLMNSRVIMVDIERRKSIRLAHQIPCSVGSKRQLEGGVVQNFSAEGLCVHTCLAPGLGEVLDVILVNGHGKKMTVQGAVKRMARNKSEDPHSYKHSVDLGLSLIEAPWDYFQLLGTFQNQSHEERLHG
jgi:hypothetical protein